MDAHHAYLILNGGTNDFNETMEAIAVAAKALQKQIPQKTVKIVFDPGFPYRKCPQCGMTHRKAEKKSYCSGCGQMLDWED